MKQILKYVLIILLFIVVVCGITYSYLQVHYKESGSVEIIKNYYDILFSNIIIEDNKTTVKIDNEDEIASQLINDELTNLVIKFFSAKNLKMTLCRLTPNADTSITRRTIQYQCLVSSARGNITRR